MADTFIANAKVDDLRAITRSLLASGSPNLASAFTTAARSRLCQTNAKCPPNPSTLFAIRQNDGMVVPTSQLNEALSRARTLYGAGMGFASLGVLESVVRATIGLRWEDVSELSDILALVDADISQAIQSSKEEIDAGRIGDLASARQIVTELRVAVRDSFVDCETWGGEFPFERASGSIEFWKF
ncbi:hypothetical protein PILCRDRAFT_827939 [Piloderma croceum F 1598]|uniref:Uncharacterized protein n=1 Tax=Piloderma croceum (strain F 1598) TaxID=765440 RepID=A0A0C3F3W9_PILCF|nr:hypothetical protein PILCRDRAFT_827939 [Piloderma croceum F 1598]